jgi:glycosyltransferase involved in cell wall biosynthesis
MPLILCFNSQRTAFPKAEKMNSHSVESTQRLRVPVVLVSPVRDESQLIAKTLDSVVAQSVWPLEWVIVDDGSTDNTAEIVEAYAQRYPFIRLVRHPNRGFRKLGGGVVVAFKYGLTQIAAPEFEFIAKLDGDMSFGPKYLELMLERFSQNPRLAAVSGKVFRPEGEALVEEPIIDEHVAGQFKLYRWRAYQEIGGFVEEVLWDGIDVHTARMKGWDTLSFHHPDALLYHHRLMGSSDKNVYKGRLRWGRGIYFMGYHPLYAIASGVFRMKEKPLVIGGLLIILGYFKAALQGVPRYDNLEFRAYLQRWQLNELKQRLTGSSRS